MSEDQNLFYLTRRKKRSHLVDFVVPLDNRVKVKEGEKLDKYRDCSRIENVMLPKGDTDCC